MKIHYKHPAGGSTHEGPSGTVYEFLEDDNGRRVADVDDPQDIERFLSIQDANGVPLFATLRKKKAKTETETSQNPNDSKSSEGSDDTGSDENGENQELSLSDLAGNSIASELEIGLHNPANPAESDESATLNEPGASLEGVELN